MSKSEENILDEDTQKWFMEQKLGKKKRNKKESEKKFEEGAERAKAWLLGQGILPFVKAGGGEEFAETVEPVQIVVNLGDLLEKLENQEVIDRFKEKIEDIIQEEIEKGKKKTTEIFNEEIRKAINEAISDVRLSPVPVDIRVKSEPTKVDVTINSKSEYLDVKVSEEKLKTEKDKQEALKKIRERAEKL